MLNISRLLFIEMSKIYDSSKVLFLNRLIVMHVNSYSKNHHKGEIYTIFERIAEYRDKPVSATK